MKKLLMILLMVGLVIGVGYGYSMAITGHCANCHTMHNSQGGAAMTADGTTHDSLLRATCVSCHTATQAGMTTPYNAPAVYHSAGLTAADTPGPGVTNAGGDFYYVTLNDSYGHNVAGIASADGTLSTPPGFDPAATNAATTGYSFGQIAGGTWTAGSQVTCAGATGCHGNHSASDPMAAIKGAHHGNGGTNDVISTAPTTVAGSYRFLAGIMGQEDADWQWTASATDHNEYYGVDDKTARNGASSYSNLNTISFLCAQCHGNFHSDIDVNDPAASPWRRHPTDIALPNSGEYSAYTTYSIEAPVARPTITGTVSGSVTPGTDVVMCLSCHRAHGSNQPDLLRWKYTDMTAGTTGAGAGKGCFTCHTTKDGI